MLRIPFSDSKSLSRAGRQVASTSSLRGSGPKLRMSGRTSGSKMTASASETDFGATGGSMTWSLRRTHKSSGSRAGSGGQAASSSPSRGSQGPSRASGPVLASRPGLRKKLDATFVPNASVSGGKGLRPSAKYGRSAEPRTGVAASFSSAPDAPPPGTATTRATASTAAAMAAASSATDKRSVTDRHGFLYDQDIHALVRRTGYSRRDVYRVFALYKSLCAMSSSPQGLDQAAMVQGIPMLAVEDDLFVSRFFQTLDSNKNGVIDWQEFVYAISVLEIGSRERRATLLFRLYDEDDDGRVSTEDFYKFFVSSLGVEATPYIEEVSRYFVSRLFSMIEGDGASILTLPSVLTYLAEHPEIENVYSFFGRSMAEDTVVTEDFEDEPVSAAAEQLFEHIIAKAKHRMVENPVVVPPGDPEALTELQDLWKSFQMADDAEKKKKQKKGEGKEEEGEEGEVVVVAEEGEETKGEDGEEGPEAEASPVDGALSLEVEAMKVLGEDGIDAQPSPEASDPPSDA